MPIEMIGCHIQHDGNLRMEGPNGLQLKTRDLEHDHGVGLRPLRQRNGRSADVSAHQRGQSGRCQNLAAQRGRGGLPVRSSNCHNWPRQKLRRQFNLADHRLAQRPRLQQRRRVHRNSRAHDNQILPAKRALAVPAGFHRNSVIEQSGNLVAQIVSALRIGHGNQCAVRSSKTAPTPPRTCPRPTTSTRLSLSSIKFISPPFGKGGESIYLSFSVVSANSANTSDAIQKRTIIFDSDQPISSKW